MGKRKGSGVPAGSYVLVGHEVNFFDDLADEMGKGEAYAILRDSEGYVADGGTVLVRLNREMYRHLKSNEDMHNDFDYVVKAHVAPTVEVAKATKDKVLDTIGRMCMIIGNSSVSPFNGVSRRNILRFFRVREPRSENSYMDDFVVRTMNVSRVIRSISDLRSLTRAKRRRERAEERDAYREGDNADLLGGCEVTDAPDPDDPACKSRNLQRGGGAAEFAPGFPAKDAEHPGMVQVGAGHWVRKELMEQSNDGPAVFTRAQLEQMRDRLVEFFADKECKIIVAQAELTGEGLHSAVENAVCVLAKREGYTDEDLPDVLDGALEEITRDVGVDMYALYDCVVRDDEKPAKAKPAPSRKAAKAAKKRTRRDSVQER